MARLHLSFFCCKQLYEGPDTADVSLCCCRMRAQLFCVLARLHFVVLFPLARLPVLFFFHCVYACCFFCVFSSEKGLFCGVLFLGKIKRQSIELELPLCYLIEATSTGESLQIGVSFLNHPAEIGLSIFREILPRITNFFEKTAVREEGEVT